MTVPLSSSLLHLDSSANRCGESVTRELTALFADAWRARHGDAGYRYRDLAADPAPPLRTGFCTLGRRVERHGLVAPDDVAALAENREEEREWALSRPLIAELRAAHTVLMGAPMYNLSVSALLKAWIDRVTFPGALRDHPGGGSALARTRVVIVTACGGRYGPEPEAVARDFATQYLLSYLARNGIPREHVDVVTADLTLADLAPELAAARPHAAAARAHARTEAARLGATL